MSVTLYHRALKRTVTVPESSAAALRRSGWTDPYLSAPARSSAPKVAATEASESPSPTGDDPTPTEED